ncbi:Lysosomal Pro-X carboxypeptidase [Hordeum vulgare]|nr:Lysosomal Pro-X carboxypeptidase [Hordeum vulgare]
MLAEATTKKEMKKAKGAPRVATPTAPKTTATTRVAAANGKKNRDRQVLDEMSTSVEMNGAEFLGSLESSDAVGLDELNYDSFWDHSAAAQDMEQNVTGEEEEEAEEEALVEKTL